MVQKKLNQKKTPKNQDKTDQQQLKDEKIVKNNETKNNDVNNNIEKKIVIKNEFCKEDHFVCSKFTDEQFNLIRDALIKLKDDKELIDQLDIDHINEILDDHHLQTRYMMRQRRDSDKQLEFIIKTLRWREENHISKIRKDLFPREAIEMGN